MIRAQQESINSLKQMLAQLLENRRKSPPKKSKGKQKGGESSSSVHPEEKGHSTLDSSNSSSRGKDDQEKIHSRRMNRLERRLEALTNRKGLQEAGVVRPYPAEWDLVPYPSKFNAPTLKHSMGRGHPTNISTTLNLKQGM